MRLAAGAASATMSLTRPMRGATFAFVSSTMPRMLRKSRTSSIKAQMRATPTKA